MMFYVVNAVMQIWIYGFDVFFPYFVFRFPWWTVVISLAYTSVRVWDRLHR